MSQSDLEKLNAKYPTDAGLAYLSERSVFKGKDLHNELSDMSWFELNLFGITGRQFSDGDLKILNYIWTSTSYADIRIWPNRISALASSARTTPILSMVAGIASCDAELFVATPLVNCLSMYRSFRNKLNNGQSLESLLEDKIENNETIFGFGRPISSVDERVPHLVMFLNSLERDKGESFKMAFQINDYLKRTKKIQMNIAALYSAICADLGFNEVEMNLFVSLLVFAGMPPCYMDTLEKPPGALLPLKCSDIKYTGSEPKNWLNENLSL